jgi:Prophage minor tail protein Z (GPZ)
MAKASRVYGHAIGRNGETIGRVRDLGRGGRASGEVAIGIDTNEIGELADLLLRAAAASPQAVARALNRTVEETSTAVARALATQTGLKYGVVRKALTLWRANAGSLVAAIIARGSFVPLKEFGARQTRKGVSAAPWNKRRVFPHTFIIARYGGNVYARAGKGRFPLHKLYGPAIPVELPKDQSANAFYATAPAVLAKRLDHELGQILTK